MTKQITTMLDGMRGSNGDYFTIGTCTLCEVVQCYSDVDFS